MARITSYLPQLVEIRSTGAHLIGGYEGTLLARFEISMSSFLFLAIIKSALLYLKLPSDASSRVDSSLPSRQETEPFLFRFKPQEIPKSQF
ncbi:polycystic kidney disease protein 1-like 1-like protein [Corchorus olitorius]|uniref:Polycystic kidney disease protein 1-like 1-like protein n=1 Tax=Corchorus olitorius TaxID=93759 RepID=A0A1R3GEI8_9ROSI|nr:polycystic kidney disease protein 1-like 1-like protein [Corchorus olitorius]